MTRQFIYYENGRLKSVSFSDGTPAQTYRYDGNGNLTELDDGTGKKAMQYDAFNNPVSVVETPLLPGRMSATFTYTYNDQNARAAMAVLGAMGAGSPSLLQSLIYRRLENGQLLDVTDVDGQKTAFTYDGIGRVASMAYPNGVAIGKYQYDQATGEPASLTWSAPDGNLLASYAQTYDADLNVLTTTDGSYKVGYTNNGLDELVNYTTPEDGGDMTSFAYDGWGNRTAKYLNDVQVDSMTYGDDNMLLSNSSFNFGYDKAGNLQSKTAADGGSMRLIWDGLDRLSSVNYSPPAGGKLLGAYQYDGDNVRVRKTFSNGVFQDDYNDGLSTVVESSNGSVSKIYVPGISYKDANGNKFFLLSSLHGDVTKLLDQEGNVVQAYRYDPLGNVIGGTKDSNGLRYVGAAGVFSDDDTGLQYMWNRWYDPQLGRFISRDPLGFGGGSLNLYEYVGNNPLGGIDPWGLFNGAMFVIGVGQVAGGVLGFAGIATAEVGSFGASTPVALIGVPAAGWAVAAGGADVTAAFNDSKAAAPSMGEAIGNAFGPVSGPIVSWGIDTALMGLDGAALAVEHSAVNATTYALDAATSSINTSPISSKPAGGKGCK